MSTSVIAGLRQGHREIVRINPTSITITRTTKSDLDGGYAQTVTSVGPITVRLYQETNQAGQAIQDDSGRRLDEVRWGLIAEAGTDIRAEPLVRDEFTVPGLGRFRIEHVYPMRVAGQAFGVHAALTRIG